MTPKPEVIPFIQTAVRARLLRQSSIYSDDITLATIEEWEARRPKDNEAQLIRTNHALAGELKDAADRWRKLHLEYHALHNSHSALAEELAAVKKELNERLHERTQAFLAKEKALDDLCKMRGTRLQDAAAEIARLEALLSKPLSFGEPPAGHEWHNPENLTPEQVGIAEGWRLQVKGEERTDATQFWDDDVGPPHFSNVGKNRCGNAMCRRTTYRTKAPLPAPKPTAADLEEAALMDAFRSTGEDGTKLYGFRIGWKAARAAKGGSQV